MEDMGVAFAVRSDGGGWVAAVMEPENQERPPGDPGGLEASGSTI
jgi:hypothetical protein